MDEQFNQIEAFLDALGRRWRRLASLRLVTRVSLGLAVVWGMAALGWLLVGRGTMLAETVLVACAVLASGVIGFVAWRRWPSMPGRLALSRFAEDHVDGLDDRLVTVVDAIHGHRVDRDGAVATALIADTSAHLPLDGASAVVTANALSAAGRRAIGATALAAGCIAVLALPATRVARMAWLYVSPVSLVFDVQPGNVRLRPATPLTIRVRTSAAGHGLAPDLEVRMQQAARRTRMEGQGGDQFATTFSTVPASFIYHVELAGRRSPDYTVTLLTNPRVKRIDLTYAFPSFTKLASRTENDGGDIYAPAGTRVHLAVSPHTTTAPIVSGTVALRTGRIVPLTRQPDGALSGDLVITTDDAYRVKLTDADGLQNTEDPEYFVRMLDDRPPDVRIVRPAGDRQVTPLEEIEIEARADDDHGVAGLELVYGVRGGRERAVPLGGDGSQLSVTGKHTVYLEDLNVKPGDFVAFYARARDIGRGKRPTQARSDIYFLEVTPFIDEFALAQSQAMAGGGGEQMDDLVRQQKDIIVGTWKLEARTARSGTTAAAEDLATLGRAQGNVRRRTEAAAQMRAGSLVLRRPGLAPDQDSSQSPLAEAASAMGRAEQALHGRKVPQALPAEMEALNHLLRAQAEAQRKQVTRQQANGGGGFNRAQQDLSTLFDRELARQQQTNYETPKTAEERREDQTDDTLERVRELARRQEALARQQEDLARERARMDAEEVKRRLERLTREQSELRREAEMLAQQLQSAERRAREQQMGQRGSQSQSGQQQSSGEPERESAGNSSGNGSQSSAVRQASEDMRNAAGNLRREDTEQARQQSARALERLQGVERALRNSGPDERRRAMGDAQLEARQLAERQRQLTDGAADAAKRNDADARRRTAAEQQRLAERVDALHKRLGELGSGGDRAERDRLSAAARELEDGRSAERMRELARGLQKGSEAGQAETGRDLARSLERLADRIGGSTGKNDPEGKRLAEDLSRTRELRERLGELQRQMAELGRQGKAGDQPGQTDDGRQSAQQSGERSPSSGQSGQQGSQSSNGRGNGEPGTSANTARGEAGDRERGERARQIGALRQRYLEELRRAGQTDERIRELSPSTNGYGATPEGQGMVSSAPGTEAFKQDFTRWETLHRELTLGLERLESDLSQRVIDKAAKDRLRSGSADRTPVEYRSSVDKYFRTLAQEPH